MHNIFNEIMSDKFSKLYNKMKIEIKKAYGIPSIQIHNKTTPTHIIMKMPNIQDKNRILKTAREK